MGKRVIVGGLPSPIGGVTTFIKRLVSHNIIDVVVDLYPSQAKDVPTNYTGVFKQLKGTWQLPFFMFINFYFKKEWVVHFNFSRAPSLLLFSFIPKGKNRFELMLHHGELSWKYPSIVIGFLLKKFDLIYCMNEKQKSFYLKNGVAIDKIRMTSSYVKPIAPSGNYINNELESFFEDGNVIVGSGYPSEIYNHNWLIEYVKCRPSLKLALFIYGTGNCSNDLIGSVIPEDKISIFHNIAEHDFNLALERCYAYVRPTSRDSFGIAVADAVEFEIPTFASNVCKRYPGAGVFEITSYTCFEKDLDSFLDGNWKVYSTLELFTEFKYD